MRPFLLLALLLLPLALPGVLPAEDRWFMGTLAGQPLASLHQVDRGLPGGGRETTTTTLLAMRRSLPGRPELRLEIRETQVVVEDAQGLVSAFHFDHDENGTVATAEGTVAGAAIRGTAARLGRTTPVAIDLPAGTRLLGDCAAQTLLVNTGLAAGATTTFTSLALINGQVTVVRNAVTVREREGEDLLFDVVPDAMPLPMRLRLSASGELRQMTMNLGVMVLDLRPAAGPVALLGAELPPTGLVKSAGPALRQGQPNRLRLPPGAPLPASPFQREAGGLMTLLPESVPEPLSDDERRDLLAAAPQLELDDAELRAWVAGITAGLDDDGTKAEHLRLAVRSHITTKDLSKADGSALETFRSRQGDCTEHATLLCAALRIAGIPARIEVGMVYAPDYGGWVGHAWDSAWIAGRWVHLDSAYPGISRSCYLCLGYPGKVQTGAAMIVQLDRFMGRTIESVP